MVEQINTTMKCDQTFNKRAHDCDPTETASTGISPPLSFQATQLSNPDSLMSLSDASILFYRYMRLMAPSMPFVVVPDGTDPWELAEQKPFLMQVITTVAYFHDLPKQQVMVKDLMRKISEKLLMRNEKSLEVLQGILVLIAWLVSLGCILKRKLTVSGITLTLFGPNSPSFCSISLCHLLPISTSIAHRIHARSLDWCIRVAARSLNHLPSPTMSVEPSWGHTTSLP